MQRGCQYIRIAEFRANEVYYGLGVLDSNIDVRLNQESNFCSEVCLFPLVDTIKPEREFVLRILLESGA